MLAAGQAQPLWAGQLSAAAALGSASLGRQPPWAAQAPHSIRSHSMCGLTTLRTSSVRFL